MFFLTTWEYLRLKPFLSLRGKEKNSYFYFGEMSKKCFWLFLSSCPPSGKKKDDVDPGTLELMGARGRGMGEM